MTSPLIDLNAARREAGSPDGIPVLIGEHELLLPAELPVEVFDPLLSEDLDLVGAVVEVLNERSEAADRARRLGEDLPDSAESYTDAILRALTARPQLPTQTLLAIKGCYRVLFGDEQFALWESARPSVNDYVRLTQALVAQYGVSLGGLFASPEPSESDGPTSKPTSKRSTGSTRAPRSGPRAVQAS